VLRSLSQWDAAPALRRAVLERGKRPGPQDGGPCPELASNIDKVARHAYKVTDAELASSRPRHSQECVRMTGAATVGQRCTAGARHAALRGRNRD